MLFGQGATRVSWESAFSSQQRISWALRWFKQLRWCIGVVSCPRNRAPKGSSLTWSNNFRRNRTSLQPFIDKPCGFMDPSPCIGQELGVFVAKSCLRPLLKSVATVMEVISCCKKYLILSGQGATRVSCASAYSS